MSCPWPWHQSLAGGQGGPPAGRVRFPRPGIMGWPFLITSDPCFWIHLLTNSACGLPPTAAGLLQLRTDRCRGPQGMEARGSLVLCASQALPLSGSRLGQVTNTSTLVFSFVKCSRQNLPKGVRDKAPDLCEARASHLQSSSL